MFQKYEFLQNVIPLQRHISIFHAASETRVADVSHSIRIIFNYTKHKLFNDNPNPKTGNNNFK